jgi:hypothetical protein
MKKPKINNAVKDEQVVQPEVQSRGFQQQAKRSIAEHYLALRDSDMSITAIAKYLKKHFSTVNQLNNFASDNNLTVPTISKKTKDTNHRNVAIEVWQQRRIQEGKGRYPYADLIDSDPV